jgi:hypothetical protein
MARYDDGRPLHRNRITGAVSAYTAECWFSTIGRFFCRDAIRALRQVVPR